ncbi:MAG: BLUF domain-containing protein [Sulfuricurvum sp.]|nr:BLUF domain-containing protein [Sulfuricurvum sp.]
MEKKLYSWLYISKPIEHINFNSIQKILTSTSRYTTEHGLSGGLIYDQDHFIHYIEGQKSSIALLRNKMESDKNPSKIVTIIFEEIDKRHFTNWTMSYITHDMYKKIIPSLKGFNPYATDSKKLLDIIETIQMFA